MDKIDTPLRSTIRERPVPIVDEQRISHAAAAEQDHVGRTVAVEVPDRTSGVVFFERDVDQDRG